VLVAGTYSKAQVIRIEPALNIPTALLDEVLNRLEDTFREVSTRLRGVAGRRVEVAGL
jgi:acetylornithine/succinyldiaminopimelate/putrescine aminotransferase